MPGPSTSLSASAVAQALAGEIAAGCRPLAPLPELVEREVLPTRPHAVVVVPPDAEDAATALLLERAQWLRDSDFVVTIVHHDDVPRTSATTLRVPAGLDLVTAVPTCDVILVGSWSQVGTARSLGIAPVVHIVTDAGALGRLPAGDVGGEHPAEEHAAHLAAALGAADLTIASGVGARDSLRSGHGVAARLVPTAAPVVDARRVLRAPRSADATLRILQFGWDGDPEIAATRGRQAAAALRAAGHDVHLTLAMSNWPVEPLGEYEARVPMPRSAEGLTALLDAADVLLVPGTADGRDAHVLAAFAHGLPVVAVRRPGDELLTDGVDALLADPTTLTGSLARIAADPSLAAALTNGGLATADRHSPSALAERLAGLIRPLTLRQVAPNAASWTLDIKGLEFDGGPTALRALQERLATVAAGQVAVPVSRPAFDGHRLVRWTVVARRKGGHGTLRLFVPARAAAPDPRHRWWNGIKALTWNRPDEAARFFLGAYRTATPATQPLLWRWIAVAALGIGHTDDAMEAAASGLAVWPDHPDFHYLLGMAAAAQGDGATAAAEWAQIRDLGTAACRYDEWFADTEKLLATQLASAA